MILPRDRILSECAVISASEKMMHMVPQLSVSPEHHPNPQDTSCSTFDFDLDLLDCQVPNLEPPLPSLSSQLDCLVPSPTSCLSPIDSTSGSGYSPTMFSPADSTSSIQKEKKCPTYAPIASPVSIPPTSPYSPPISSSKRARLTSTDSSVSACSSAISVQDSLSELHQLHERVNREHQHLDTFSGSIAIAPSPCIPPIASPISAPPPYPQSPKEAISSPPQSDIPPIKSEWISSPMMTFGETKPAQTNPLVRERLVDTPQYPSIPLFNIKQEPSTSSSTMIQSSPTIIHPPPSP